MTEGHDPIQLVFLTEAAELREDMEQALLELERAGHSQSLVDRIFRAAHTIKGSAGMAGYPLITSFMHEVEGFLDQVRAGERTVTPDRISHLLRITDLLGQLLESPHVLPPGAREQVEALLSDAPATLPTHHWRIDLRFRPELFESGTDPLMFLEDMAALPGTLVVRPILDALPPFDELDPTRCYLAWEVDYAGTAPRESFEQILEFVQVDHPVRVAEASSPQDPPATPPLGDSPMPEAPTPVPPRSPVEVEPEHAAVGPARNGDATIRVAVSLLDKLVNLVGELVLNRNQILQYARHSQDQGLLAPVSRLNLITTDLQEAVMRTRMQPIKSVWDKLPRIVRDYCRDSGKQVELELEGQETELDKSLLEVIKDPLTHILRNSLDHGIESPAARLAAGKPATGTIHLVAYHDGGQITVEVRDDGAGLNLDRIRAKAREQGLYSHDVLVRMSDPEVAQIIFHPGFSTAEAVSAVSGRGVGMDVVKTNVERIGGTVEISSHPGRGTNIKLRVPLTLAVLPALIIHAGAERFAIPQSELLEVVRTGEGTQTIEQLRGSMVFRLRESLIPVVSLRAVLGLPASEATEELNLVILHAGTSVFGLAVDEIGDTEEIVVKSLHRFFQGLEAYSGVTILGDGRACMILDVAGLAARGQLELTVQAESETTAQDASLAGEGDQQQLLLVRLGDTRRFAIPMALVARLEELAITRLEQVGERFVTQYAGGLLPILDFTPMLGLPSIPAADPIPVVVVGEGERRVGIRVLEICDIVEDRMIIHPTMGVPGVLGATVIHGKTMEVLDLHSLIAQVHPEWFKQLTPLTSPRTVLLAEDSKFFRSILHGHLTGMGYRVLEAEDGLQALELLETETVDVLLSDIEMPVMDGLELIRRVRAAGRWDALPAIALTTRSSTEDRAVGIAAGFTTYMAKYDRQAVTEALSQYLLATR